MGEIIDVAYRVVRGPKRPRQTAVAEYYDGPRPPFWDGARIGALYVVVGSSALLALLTYCAITRVPVYIANLAGA